MLLVDCVYVSVFRNDSLSLLGGLRCWSTLSRVTFFIIDSFILLFNFAIALLRFSFYFIENTTDRFRLFFGCNR